PGEDDHLLASIFQVLQNVPECLELRLADLPDSIAYGEESACDLLESEQLCQDDRRRDLLLLGEPNDRLLGHLAVECPGLRLELDVPELVNGIREIEAFVLPNPEGNLANLFDQLLEILVPDDLIAAVASHDGIPVAELPE